MYLSYPSFDKCIHSMGWKKYVWKMGVDTLKNEISGILGQIFGKMIIVIPFYQVIER